MEQLAYSKSGKECGTVVVTDRSRPGQRCVTYTNYRSTVKRGN